MHFPFPPFPLNVGKERRTDFRAEILVIYKQVKESPKLSCIYQDRKKVATEAEENLNQTDRFKH